MAKAAQALARALEVTTDELLGLRVAEEAPGYGPARPHGELREEEKLLGIWRELPERDRAILMGLARTLADQENKARRGKGWPKARRGGGA